MTTPISEIINVSLVEAPAALARDNMNVVAMLTSQQDGPLSSLKRFELYQGAAAVANDFGSGSQIATFARTFFATRPNPVNADGVLVVGYWRAGEEDVPATAATLTGAEVSEAQVVQELQAVTDGAFTIEVDGTPVAVTGLDLQTVTSLADVAAVLDTEIAGATVEASGNRLVITSATTGALSALSFMTDPGTGSFIGNTLGLAEGTGAVLEQGAAEDTLTAETKLEALQALRERVGIKGAMFLDKPTSAEALELAEFGQAENLLQYDVFSDPDNLTVSADNVAWEIKLGGFTNYRMLYSAAGNRRFAAAYMARTHTVNFAADNSAITLHLKQLPITPEDYTTAERQGAAQVGLDLYTTVKQSPIIITSGANNFVDNRYNLLAFVDAVQTDLFNVLGTTTTKIPQTRSGVNALVNAAEGTSRQFRNARFIAPGAWNSADFFGDQATFLRNIAENGFYWKAGDLADQPQADREARKSPPLQGAIKAAGAIHSADVIINFEQ